MKAICITFVLLLLPSVIVSQVLSREDGWNTYINKSYNIRLFYPSTCNYIEETSDCQRYQAEGMRDGLNNVWQWRNRLFLLSFKNFDGVTIRSLITIVVIDNQDNYSLVEVAEKLLHKISEHYKDYKSYEVIYDSLTIDNVPALHVSGKINQNDDPDDDIVKFGDFFLCSNKGLVYEISISWPIDRDKVLNSIEWLGFTH